MPLVLLRASVFEHGLGSTATPIKHGLVKGRIQATSEADDHSKS
jgi:hypothetical protein